MGEASLRPWATDLPPEAAAAIMRHLPCSVDRGTVAAVCRNWRSFALALDYGPAALPWLRLPGPDLTRLHCLLSDSRVHRHIVGLPDGSRCFGSHDGGWLFLAYGQRTREHVHVLLNIHDASSVYALPDLVRIDQDPHGMQMLAATLSAPPDDPSCVAACIFTPGRGSSTPVLRRFAFWRMGSTVALDLRPDAGTAEPAPGQPTPEDLEIDDIVFHQGAFHLLTRGEHMFVFQPPFNSDGEGLKLFEQPEARDYGGLVVRGRYLVVSRKELLMVVRISYPDQFMTSGFKVFRVIPPMLTRVLGAKIEYRWGELDKLDGQMLFLGRGCSRAYDVDDYPWGFKESIFFYGDHSFCGEMVQRQCTCTDIGKWSEGCIQYLSVEHCSSPCCPGFWILPSLQPKLPMDMVIHIILQMRCDPHMFRALRACKLKRECLSSDRATGQVPWLLLPSTRGISLHCLTCGGGLLGATAIHYPRLPAKFEAARFFGSFDGRLVFLVLDDVSYTLLNTISGESYSLPRHVTWLAVRKESVHYEQILLAATLSSAPDNKDCIAAGIIRYGHNPTSAAGPLCQITVWRMGSDAAIDPLAFPERPGYADDIIFYGRELHVVTRYDQLMVWTPIVLPDGSLNAEDGWRVFYIGFELNEKCARSRYLVESRGDLLLVIKFGNTAEWSSAMTEHFRVFQLTVPGSKDIIEAFPICPCVELKNLDDRVLFVGRGCSRSYELKLHPGLKAGIYFMDDWTFYNDEMMSCGVSSRKFSCSDNGKWVERLATGVERCYSLASQDYINTCSPPAWLLP